MPSEIPPIPRMSALDEEWIEWASAILGVTTEQARGALAGFYTMRARSLPEGIDSIKRTIAGGEQSLLELPAYAAEYPQAVAQDKQMWEKLLPQLRQLAR